MHPSCRHPRAGAPHASLHHSSLPPALPAPLRGTIPLLHRHPQQEGHPLCFQRASPRRPFHRRIGAAKAHLSGQSLLVLPVHSIRMPFEVRCTREKERVGTNRFPQTLRHCDTNLRLHPGMGGLLGHRVCQGPARVSCVQGLCFSKWRNSLSRFDLRIEMQSRRRNRSSRGDSSTLATG